MGCKVNQGFRTFSNLKVMEAIEKLKCGEYFRRTPTAKKTYIRRAYNRTLKRYEAQNYDDISHFIYLRKGKQVFTNFEF